MKLSPSWEAANCAATQELPSILWNLKVQYCVQKSPPLVPILSQINPVHTIQFYLRFILILFTYLRLRLPSSLFPSGFPTNILHAFFFAPIRVTCSAHLILIYLIIIINLTKSTSYEAPHYAVPPPPPQHPITSSLFDPSILLSTLFSNILRSKEKKVNYCWTREDDKPKVKL
jgi:hypothetical protein